MQPMKILISFLEKNASPDHYLFTPKNLKVLLPELSPEAFKTLLSRAAKQTDLERIARGLYAYKANKNSRGLLLFHAAAYLRWSNFNYISLETALSDAGVISQIPINYISVMTSGRSSKISCGRFGTIDFIHTSNKPNDVVKELVYDRDCRLWRATVKLALQDMKRTRRNMDLIDWDEVDEHI